ncbi:DDX19A [Branchiostoma lanceolatum]|uniref:RNA helicase n=1 Tax=Branchiostoma lanceolatum TaxID=7740 RepID=A0A8J9VKB2_BRALA|nr:DDX19A [Branchiostoma lanceolatum]
MSRSPEAGVIVSTAISRFLYELQEVSHLPPKLSARMRESRTLGEPLSTEWKKCGLTLIEKKSTFSSVLDEFFEEYGGRRLGPGCGLTGKQPADGKGGFPVLKLPSTGSPVLRKSQYWSSCSDDHFRTGCPLKDVKIDPEKKTPEAAAGAGDGDDKTAASSGSAASSAEANGEKPADGDEKAPSPEEVSFLRKVLRERLVQNKNEVEIMQKDPNSPLYSVKSFEELNLPPDLLMGVYHMGFNAPSKIQETALPMLLADDKTNMIAQSQSGTGKTAAFVLTMLSRIDTKKPYPQALCLAPTMELALQIGQVVEQMGKYMEGLKVAYGVRGNKVARGQKLGDHIIIGTPGTVLDWSLKLRVIDLRKVEVFVLDEADVMIATQGHQDQSIRIHKNLSRTCQMLLFSATYDDPVMAFAQVVVPDPVIIRLRREEESLDNIKQYYVTCENRDAKFRALSNIYGVVSIGQCMIFCHTGKTAAWLAEKMKGGGHAVALLTGELLTRKTAAWLAEKMKGDGHAVALLTGELLTRKTAAWLAEKMKGDGHAVALLTGELLVEQRVSVINRFRDGKEKVLITTNLCARGIDIEQVTLVVNFDIPVDQFGQPDCENYLHRIGRTGRFGKTGLAINMVDGPRSMSQLSKIQDHFGKKIAKLDTEDAEAIETAVGEQE